MCTKCVLESEASLEMTKRIEEAADPIDPEDEPVFDEDDQFLRALASDVPAPKRTVLAGPSSGKPRNRWGCKGPK